MKSYFLLILLFGVCKIFSQEDEGGEKKYCVEVSKEAQKLYEKGADHKKYHKPERLEFLRKCLEEEPDFAEANLAMGFEIIVHCKLENKPFSPAIPYFLKAIKNCPQIHSEPYYYIGFDFYDQQKDDSASKYLNKFIKFKDNDEKKFAKDYEGELYNAKEMCKQVKKESALKSKPPVPFDPRAVLGVSTTQDEYLAYVSPDDKKCFFTRKVPKNSKNQVYASDKEKEVFMRAERDATGVFNVGEPMDWPFNETDDNQGGCTITIDNKHLYFAMMKTEGGNDNCDLYVSNDKEGAWQPFTKLSALVNDPVYWDSQPTVSADGKSIIFASDRPGGFGGIDLYITRLDTANGEPVWRKPLNLGPKINTAGHEKTPFLHSDSQTLYFSSGPGGKGEGHFGYGKMDIFYARKNEKGEWTEPVNIGQPINSEGDDTGFFVSSDAQTGYFFSYDEGKVRGRGVGRYDLYSFPLYKEARPDATMLVKGQAVDQYGDGVRNVEVEARNSKTNEILSTITDARTGEYMIAMSEKIKEDVIITVKKTENAFSSIVIKAQNATFANPPKPPPIISDVAEVGKSFVINNIYYNSNSADLMEESKVVLKTFAEYLKTNPKMNIEIQGHTDNVGSASANQALSENRAYTVKSVLEKFGIEPDRISEKGYGSSKPLTDNSSEAGRAKNRRTEFLILSN